MTNKTSYLVWMDLTHRVVASSAPRSRTDGGTEYSFVIEKRSVDALGDPAWIPLEFEDDDTDVLQRALFEIGEHWHSQPRLAGSPNNSNPCPFWKS